MKLRSLPLLSLLIVVSLLIQGAPLPAAARAEPGPAEPAAPSAFSCDAVTEIPKAECEALVALYNSTNGVGWKNSTGWLVTDTPCRWYGVRCSQGHVEQLWLYSNQLNGSIPPQLANLANLWWLVLYNNQLTGAIPSQLGALANLEYLEINDNQLTGAIPSQLGSLAKLQSLLLRNNQLTGATLEWDACLEDNIFCPFRDLNTLNLLNELTTRYRLVNAYVYGWLPAGTYGGGISDPTWNGGAGKAAFGDDHPSEGQRIFAHEIGHLLGRRHTNSSSCHPENIDPQSDWPYPDSLIQEYGLDTYGFGWLVSSSSAIVNPADTYDYMSYCGSLANGDVWTSPWTYQHIYDEALKPVAAGQALGQIRTPETYFIASGLVFTDSTAMLNPAWVITATVTPNNPPVGTAYCKEIPCPISFLSPTSAAGAVNSRSSVDAATIAAAPSLIRAARVIPSRRSAWVPARRPIAWKLPWVRQGSSPASAPAPSEPAVTASMSPRCC
jgi:hypothetical protein